MQEVNQELVNTVKEAEELSEEQLKKLEAVMEQLVATDATKPQGAQKEQTVEG